MVSISISIWTKQLPSDALHLFHVFLWILNHFQHWLRTLSYNRLVAIQSFFSSHHWNGKPGILGCYYFCYWVILWFEWIYKLIKISMEWEKILKTILALIMNDFSAKLVFIHLKTTAILRNQDYSRFKQCQDESNFQEIWLKQIFCTEIKWKLNWNIVIKSFDWWQQSSPWIFQVKTSICFD